MKPQKLNWQKVDRIRGLYKPGECGYRTLARMFDVSPASIKSIIRGEAWPEGKRKFFEMGSIQANEA